MAARVIAFLLLMLAAPALADAPPREWAFEVSLDDRVIGEHRFLVRETGHGTEVESLADFDVSLLGFSIYTYHHEARELWKDGCLHSLEAETDDNGTETSVRGLRTGDAFVVESGAAPQTLPGCTMTFAYWNPAFRGQRQLLNPQTGDFLDVRFEESGRASFAAGADGASGVSGEALRYVLRGRDLEITLWYSREDDRWLALDSLGKGGRRIRYRLR